MTCWRKSSGSLAASDVEALAARLAQSEEVAEHGEWLRHVPVTHVARALEGSTRIGRWGTRGGFPILYLGRPQDSVVVEAYRHLVDPVEFDSDADREAFMTGLVPRTLLTCTVNVTCLLDLRTDLGRDQAGLTVQELMSATVDRGAYGRCQHVSQAARELGRHGIIAPAATGMGETLALFVDVLPDSEIPRRSRDDQIWPRLPDDPRVAPRPVLRLVENREKRR
jgi:hypothetical protein